MCQGSLWKQLWNIFAFHCWQSAGKNYAKEVSGVHLWSSFPRDPMWLLEYPIHHWAGLRPETAAEWWRKVENRAKTYILLTSARPLIQSYREMHWRQLSKLGIAAKFISILEQLHDGRQARVLTGELQSQYFKLNAGVKQGCVLTHAIFNLLFYAITHLFNHDLRDGDGVHIENGLDRSLFDIWQLHAHTNLPDMPYLWATQMTV